MTEANADIPAVFAMPRAGRVRRRGPTLAALQAELRRLSLALVGPVLVAGMQFSASMVLWSTQPAGVFGLFVFAQVLIQLSQGVSNALVGTPLSVAPHGARRDLHIRACLAAHAIYLAAIAAAFPLVLWLSDMRSGFLPYILLIVATNLRWTARSHAIAAEDIVSSTRSDCLYAIVGAILLVFARALDLVTIDSVVLALSAAHGVALAANSRAFLRVQLASLKITNLVRYRRRIWSGQSRWAIAGVAGSEASTNAHAYIITWLWGTAMFAPVAFGALFCRPLTIFLTALTQIDRPIFARHIASGAEARVRRLLRMSFASAVAVWLGNLALAMTVLEFFAAPIAARGYDIGEIETIVMLWFAIMACRAVRNPLSTYIQAKRVFRGLAYRTLVSAAVSLGTALMLALVSPVWSLVGVLCGEVVLLCLIVRLSRKNMA